MRSCQYSFQLTKKVQSLIGALKSAYADWLKWFRRGLESLGRFLGSPNEPSSIEGTGCMSLSNDIKVKLWAGRLLGLENSTLSVPKSAGPGSLNGTGWSWRCVVRSIERVILRRGAGKHFLNVPHLPGSMGRRATWKRMFGWESSKHRRTGVSNRSELRCDSIANAMAFFSLG